MSQRILTKKNSSSEAFAGIRGGSREPARELADKLRRGLADCRERDEEPVRIRRHCPEAASGRPNHKECRPSHWRHRRFGGDKAFRQVLVNNAVTMPSTNKRLRELCDGEYIRDEFRHEQNLLLTVSAN